MAGRRLVLRGGRVIDPARGLDEVCDLVAEDGRVAAVGRGLGPAAPPGPGGPAAAWRADDGTLVIEAAGMLVVPGLVDLHAHLRTPGQEWKEDLASGTAAAAAGGYTTVCCMPNTDPPLDSGAVVEWVRRRAEAEGLARVLPVGCVSRGRQGRELAEIGELAAAGAVALSDDGAPVRDAGLMRRALEYARAFGLPVSAHEEEESLAAGGVMHLGSVSAALGLRGQPAEAEAVMVARDVLLAGWTGGHLHVAHVSSAAAVEIIRQAKARGIRVTAEVTPHHLVLTHEAVRGGGVAGAPGYDANAKCNPPLRTEEDRLALLEGLRDGTIDAVATDHAPHRREDKEKEFDYAPFGVVQRPGAEFLPPDDKGRLVVTRAPDDAYSFKVPSLRNVALTAPYFHAGSSWDLEQAVAVMGTAQLGVELSPEETKKVAAFLVSLTGRQPSIVLPVLPPSVPSTPRPKS